MLLTEDPRLGRAMELMNGADYLGALREIDVVLGQLNGEDRLAGLYWKINCLTWLGKVNEARSCVDQALAATDIRDPLRICLELQSAYLLRDERTPEVAAVQIRALLDRYAVQMVGQEFFWVYVQAKTYLGNCLLLSGRYSESTAALEEALSLEIQPLGRYYIQFWLGDACYQIGELEKAKGHFEHALSEEKSVPELGLPKYYSARLRYELALVAQRQRRLEDAKRELERASAVGVQDPDLLSAITRLRESLKDSTSAH